MTSETAAGALAEAEPGEPDWQWLSPRSLVVRPVTDLLRALPLVVGLLFFGSRHGAPNLWGLAFAGLAIATSIVRYCTTRYRVTAERVYLRHGLLSQKVLSVPRDRIRSVDLSARQYSVDANEQGPSWALFLVYCCCVVALEV